MSATKKRDLTEADIKTLWDTPEGGVGSQASPLSRIRSIHHKLAQLLANGVKQEEISLITGYSPSYISNLKSDPAFKNLMAHYGEVKEEIYSSVHERLAALSVDSVEELQARLAEDAESFTNRELMELAELTADRSGAGPQSRNVNVNVNIGMADRLSQARARANLGEASLPTPSLRGPESPRLPPLHADLELRPNPEEPKE